MACVFAFTGSRFPPTQACLTGSHRASLVPEMEVRRFVFVNNVIRYHDKTADSTKTRQFEVRQVLVGKPSKTVIDHMISRGGHMPKAKKHPGTTSHGPRKHRAVKFQRGTSDLTDLCYPLVSKGTVSVNK